MKKSEKWLEQLNRLKRTQSGDDDIMAYLCRRMTKKIDQIKRHEVEIENAESELEDISRALERLESLEFVRLGAST